MHDLNLIKTIAAAFAAAWLLGVLTQRLRLSPIVGYLLAGILIGPHTPGFAGDVYFAQQLAEIGVILLMFGVGLHFHLDDLLAVRHIAIPGALIQSLFAAGAAVLGFWLLGFPVSFGLVMGLALAVASTVVLMRMLEDADCLDAGEGHVAVGWLLVEDIMTVVLLVLIPVLGTPTETAEEVEAGGPIGLWLSLSWALFKLAAFVLFMAYFGRRLVPWAMTHVARLNSRELFTLTVLVVSIVLATAAYYLFGASLALGAFLAGLIVAQSPLANQTAAEILPLRDAFAVIFFVSVGMLFDPSSIVREPLMLLTALAVILLVKPLIALGIVAVLGYPLRTGITVALGLAQIGEFSFILSELARKHGLMSESGHHTLVASAILSISLNPILFRSREAIERWIQHRPWFHRLLSRRSERRLRPMAIPESSIKTGSRVVIVGYGPVGRTVDQLLRARDFETVVVDANMDTVSELLDQGRLAVYGDASNRPTLERAGIQTASHMVITMANCPTRTSMVAAAREIHPAIRIWARARYLFERDGLAAAGAESLVVDEAEAADALARLVVEHFTQPPGTMPHN